MSQALPTPVRTPQSRSNIAILGFVGVAVVAFVLGVGVLVLSQDAEPYSPLAAPEASVRNYLNAFAQGDCERVADLSTQRSLERSGVGPEEAVDWCQTLPLGGILANNYEIDDIQTMRIQGDRATVEFFVSVAGISTPEASRAVLFEEQGTWKVDTIQTGLDSFGFEP